MRIATFLCLSVFLGSHAFASTTVPSCPAELARFVPPGAPSEELMTFLRAQRGTSPKLDAATSAPLWTAQGTRYGEVRARIAGAEDNPAHLRALLTELGDADFVAGEGLELSFKNGVLDEMILRLPVPTGETGEIVASPALLYAVAAVQWLEGPPRRTTVKFKVGERREIVLFSPRYYDTFSPLGVSLHWLEAAIVMGALQHGDEKMLRSVELYHERSAKASRGYNADGFVAALDRLSGWLPFEPHARAVEYLLRSKEHLYRCVQRCTSMKAWWERRHQQRTEAANALWKKVAESPADSAEGTEATAAAIAAFREALVQGSSEQVEALARWAPMGRDDLWALLRETATTKAFERGWITELLLRSLPARFLAFEATQRGTEWEKLLKAWSKATTELEVRWLREQNMDEREFQRLRTFVWERETIHPLQAALLRMLWIERYPTTISGIERGTLDYLPSGGRDVWIQTLRQVTQSPGHPRRVSAYGALLRMAEAGEGSALRELRAAAEEAGALPAVNDDWRERTQSVLAVGPRP